MCAGQIGKTTGRARWKLSRKHVAGKQPHDLSSVSQVTQPLGSQKALLHGDGACILRHFVPLNVILFQRIDDFMLA